MIARVRGTIRTVEGYNLDDCESKAREIKDVGTKYFFMFLHYITFTYFFPLP